MNKLFLSGLILPFLVNNLYAFEKPTSAFFKYNEITIGAGFSYYMGDINQKHFSQKELATSFSFKRNFNWHYAWRLGFNYGKVSATDANASNSFYKQRNLSFASPIVELSNILEFNFFPYELGHRQTPFTPYLFAGLSAFYFNPTTQLNGQTYNLKDFNTEGQGSNLYANRKKYTNYNMAIPIGVGLKFNFGQRIGLSLEWGMRRTFTDYLDDVSTNYASEQILWATGGQTAVLLANRNPNKTAPDQHVDMQRGNPTTKDWYNFTTINLHFKITKDRPCNSY